MTKSETEDAVVDVLFQTILGFTLPFFLAGAAGNPDLGRAAILELIDAYNAASARELELVGRIICLGIAAMDNLCRSMQPDLSDAKILGYRANAIHLNRSSDRYQTMLDALQAAPRISTNHRAAPIATPDPTPVTPTPVTPAPVTPAPVTPAPVTPAPVTPAPVTPAPVTPAPVTPAPVATAPITPATAEPRVAQAVSSKPQAAQPKAQQPRAAAPGWSGADLEKLPHEARMFIEAMQARGGPLSAVAQVPFVDPVAASKAAARAALAAAGVPAVPSNR